MPFGKFKWNILIQKHETPIVDNSYTQKSFFILHDGSSVCRMSEVVDFYSLLDTALELS